MTILRSLHLLGRLRIELKILSQIRIVDVVDGDSDRLIMKRRGVPIFHTTRRYPASLKNRLRVTTRTLALAYVNFLAFDFSPVNARAQRAL